MLSSLPLNEFLYLIDYSFAQMVRLVLVTLNVQVRDHWGIGMIHHPVRLGVELLDRSFVYQLSSLEANSLQFGKCHYTFANS